jgi:DNA-binding NtrC family response regulator/lipopolysaccharide/colanic/teichoic acid biosynthesis glycosyltransferase
LLDKHGDYRPCLSLLAVRETERLLRVTIAGVLLALPILLAVTKSIPRTAIALTLVMVPMLLALEKWQVQKAICVVRGWGVASRKTVILGTGTLGRRIYSTLVHSPKFGLDPVAFVGEVVTATEPVIYEESYQHRRQARVVPGPLTPKLLRRLGATALIIAGPEISQNEAFDITSEAEAAGISTYVIPEPFLELEKATEYVELDGVLLAHKAQVGRRRIYHAAKRALDVSVAAFSLLVFSPVLASAAVAVRLTSPGTVLFKQRRVGQNGAHFGMYKFRSMYIDSDRYAYSPISGNDPRITTVGRFLRRTCIDELPQLVNVLRGEMSLVGPRPEMPFIVEQYEAIHRQRLTVKPGITGLWQLSADRRSLIHQNISYDIYFLEMKGMQVSEAEGVRKAKERFRDASPDAAILDILLPDGDGLELLDHFKDVDRDFPVIVLTGQGSIETAVRAIKQNAEQFLTKPIELPALHALLERALENKRYRQQSLVSMSKAKRERLAPFLGDSAAIRKLYELARRVVSSDSPILIQGETGSGKGVLAKWIHENSGRADEVFLDLNCAGLEREFLETELFGHEKGAFTGAVHAKPGLLEVAHRGTVFLDEIGDIDPTVQPKLLKVLETGQFRRLGDVQDRTADVRLISATHRDLKELVRQQRFREDLFFRITIIPIRVPPLRERKEDIPLLARDILQRIATERGCGEIELDDAALKMLQSYTWPGNIREMRNVLERAAQIAQHSPLTVRDLELQYPGNHAANAATGSQTLPIDTTLTMKEMEARFISMVLAEERGAIERAAERLGISRSSLYSKIKNKQVERAWDQYSGPTPLPYGD